MKEISRYIDNNIRPPMFIEDIINELNIEYGIYLIVNDGLWINIIRNIYNPIALPLKYETKKLLQRRLSLYNTD